MAPGKKKEVVHTYKDIGGSNRAKTQELLQNIAVTPFHMTHPCKIC